MCAVVCGKLDSSATHATKCRKNTPLSSWLFIPAHWEIREEREERNNCFSHIFLAVKPVWENGGGRWKVPNCKRQQQQHLRCAKVIFFPPPPPGIIRSSAKVGGRGGMLFTPFLRTTFGAPFPSLPAFYKKSQIMAVIFWPFFAHFFLER